MNLPTLTISAGKGWMDQRERFSGNIAGKEQKNYTLLSKNELSYNKGNSKLAKYGVVFKLQEFNEALVPKVYHSFRTTSESYPDFIEYVFATKKPERELAKLITSGARMDGLLNIKFDDFMSIKINMTNKDEQIKIASYLKSIDNIITLHQRKIQILDNMYSLFIREIYPKKHEVVPKIRFSEYSSHWIKITLESLLKEFSIKSSIENEYQILSSTNSGMEFRRGRVSGSSNRGYKIIDNGDLVLSPQNLWLGNININKLGKGLVSPSYKTFSIDKVDGEFLEPQLRTKRMLNTFENVSTQGASVVRRNLDMDLFKQIIVKVPTNQEKEKIANLLNLIMNLIKHYDSKLMKLQTIKTEYLKKMFL